jgi:cardiolipin synthase
VSGFSSLLAEARSRFGRSIGLRRSLSTWVCVGLVLSEAYAAAVGLIARSHPVALTTILTAAWWIVVSLVFAAGAAMLESPSGEPVERYGVPNGLTGVRAWFCMPVLLTALLNLSGREGLALFAGVGGAAGMLDAVDGFVARRFGPVTKLGKALDPLMDALFFVVAAVGCYALAIMPLWLTALIVFRYAAPVLFTPFVFLAGKRPELVHTTWGRRNTTLTGVVLFTLFWVRVANGPVWIAALATAIPLLVPTLVLHLIALLGRVRSAPTVVRVPTP